MMLVHVHRRHALPLFLLVVGIAFALTPAAHAGSQTPSTGYDVSYPQCGRPLPASPAFGVVGVNDGIPFSTNPCLAMEVSWAQAAANHAPALYANTANPGPAYSSHWPTGQTSPQVCDASDDNSPGCSYDYGWNSAQNAFASAGSAAGTAPWWLDVETANSWQTLESAYGQTATSKANDVAAIDGAIAYLRANGVGQVGLYSTSYQWTQITGGTGTHFAANPDWVAGYRSQKTAKAGCSSIGFAGGAVRLTQYPLNGFDADYACP